MASDVRSDGRHDEQNGPTDANPGGVFRVLIVDDDADTSDSTAILVGQWGFQAVAVRSGFEALQAVNAFFPDLILLDIGMPGMNGLEVAKRLRVQTPPKGKRPFLIAVSGYADAQSRRHSLQAGIDLHLVKPVDPAELEKLLRRFQKVVMPAAERRLHRFHLRLRLVPTLRHWSDRALLKQCIFRSRYLVGTCKELMSQARTSQNPQERVLLRAAGYQQIARFLAETEKVRQLVLTFHSWGIHSI
jgi:CheY-like chemotaxis protein